MRRTGRRLLLAASVLAVLLIPAAQATPGALDPTFGTGGKVTTQIGTYNDYAYALVRQPDGKFVAAGTSNTGLKTDFALARYNPNGSLDTSFNGTGKVTTAMGASWDSLNDLALQPDGKLVAAGYSQNGFNFDFALARYNPNGSLDTSFNGTGKVTTPIGSSDDETYALALQPDGKLVAAGLSRTGTGAVFALARYNPNGSLDTSFNGTGKLTTAIGAYASVNALAPQPDGKLLAAGIGDNGSHFVFALARYNPNGSLDTSFNGTGKVTTPIGSVQDDAIALARQPDGKLLAAGYSSQGPTDDFALARYNPNGSLDTSFNGTGKVTTAIGSGHDDAYALALQPNGSIVAAGSSWNGSRTVFALVRYHGSTVTVTKTGSGSGSVTSSPGGISCGSTCSAPFAAVPVTLTATASAGSSFLGWSGVCSGGGSCALTMSGDRTATARFETNKTLALTRAGGGTGTVSSTPAGISCGSTCAHVYRHGSAVTLTAAASAGSSFIGWSGACSGTGSCTLTMSAARTASARFETNKTLTLTKAGRGAGAVTSAPDGISCGATCAHVYRHGTAVTLTAAASARSTFAGWSGACSGTGTCTLTMSAARSVTATFKVLCVVPKLKRKTLRAAKRALKKAHCSPGKVTRAFSAKVKKGRVISQKPKPGKKLAAGSKVKLKLSNGKA